MSTNGDNSSVRSGIKEDSTDQIRRWIEGDNKALVHRWIEESNKGSAARIDTFISTNYVHHDSTTPKVRNVEDFKQWLTRYHPSLKDIKEMVAERDRVVAHLTWCTISTPPADKETSPDKQETFTTISTFRIANRKIVEFWLDETVNLEKKEYFRWFPSIALYGLLPLVALTLIIVHITQPALKIDAIMLVLLVVAILPFLPKLLESAKLPGGWELTFRKIEGLEAEQKQQKSEIQTQQAELKAIRLLIGNLVTKPELLHLQNFKASAFLAENRGNFIPELHHLSLLGFIERQRDRGFRTLEDAFRQNRQVNVIEHFRITKEGEEFYEQYKQILAEL